MATVTGKTTEPRFEYVQQQYVARLAGVVVGYGVDESVVKDNHLK